MATDMDWVGPLLLEPEDRVEGEMALMKERLRERYEAFEQVDDLQMDVYLQTALCKILEKGERLTSEPNDGVIVVLKGRVVEEDPDNGEEGRPCGRGAFFNVVDQFVIRAMSVAFLLVIPKSDAVLGPVNEQQGAPTTSAMEEEKEKEEGRETSNGCRGRYGFLPLFTGLGLLEDQECDEGATRQIAAGLVEDDESDDSIEFLEVREAPRCTDRDGKRAKKIKSAGGKKKRRHVTEDGDTAMGGGDHAGADMPGDVLEEVEAYSDPEPDSVKQERSRFLPQRSARGMQAEVSNDTLKNDILALARKRLQPFHEIEIDEIKDAEGNPHNAQYDFLRKILDKAPEIIVFHGTSRTSAKQIATFNFDPKQAIERNNTGNNHIFFATDPRVADHYARGERMKNVRAGYLQKNIIVSRLLMSRDSHLTVTGCTGGTVKLHERSMHVLRPIYRIKYYVERERKLKLNHQGKESLEVAPAQLDYVLKKHLITIGKVPVKDFTDLGRA